MILWLPPSLLGCALLVSGWMHLKASKNAKSIAVVPASPECANLPQQADAMRLPDILTRGEHLRTQVPKVGAPPGADELWKRSAGEWEDEAKRFVSIHKHSELSRFTAFINPSEVDTKVYTPLWSAYAIFLKRLEHFREIFDPDYRIAALKGEVDELNTRLREVGAQAEAHVKESLELKARLAEQDKKHPKVVVQLAPGSSKCPGFDLVAYGADAFGISMPWIHCGEATIGWEVPRMSLNAGESMRISVGEWGKSGQFYAAPSALYLALERQTSETNPVVQSAIWIDYRDIDCKPWKSMCPVRYDHRTGKIELLEADANPVPPV